MHRDQLLAINGEAVDKLSREEIVGVIRRVEGDEIRLKVKQVSNCFSSAWRALCHDCVEMPRHCLAERKEGGLRL